MAAETAETGYQTLPGLRSRGAGLPYVVANEIVSGTVHGPAVEAMDQRS